jgi:hypothetical protein
MCICVYAYARTVSLSYCRKIVFFYAASRGSHLFILGAGLCMERASSLATDLKKYLFNA